MASQTPGIQQLLVAEKKASEKVGEARKGLLRNFLTNLNYARTSVVFTHIGQ